MISLFLTITVVCASGAFCAKKWPSGPCYRRNMEPMEMVFAGFAPVSDVTGPSRHWMSSVAYTSRKRRPGRDQERRRIGCGVLFRDAVGPLPSIALRRLNLLATLAAQYANEASHGVGLPLRDGHDLGQRRA